MTQLFLITQQDELSGSIERYFRFRGGVEVRTIVPPLRPNSVNRLGKHQWVPETFRKLASALETNTVQITGRSMGLLRAICLVDVPDLIKFDDLDPIDRTNAWTSVVGMLLLAFPEVHWALISPFKPTDKLPDADLLSRFHFLQMTNLFESVERILTLNDKGFTPLFDPTGLRHEITERLLRRRPSSAYIPVRETCAVSIDEEEAYSYFHAYAAYRFGYRCEVITSYGLMKETLSEDSQQSDLALSFEDIYLNFPDRRQSLSKLENRDTTFPKLRTIPNRIFVTSGHQNTASEKKVTEANDGYRVHLQESGVHSKILYKPDSGVFDIWEHSKMKERLAAFNGKAPGFVWPPSMVDSDSPAGTHSAPGRLLVIAETLIARANRIFDDVNSVSEAVYGAVLAINAQEYLGLRTPTTSLESVSLKHRFEVLAECMFYGVEYHLDTESRFAEIEKEIACIGVWFRAETRDLSQLNTQIGLLSELVLIYRDFNQFNEEQSGLTKLRHVYRGLWFKRHKPWSYAIWPFRWYIDQLLASIPRFIAAFSGWLVIFATLFGFAHNQGSRKIYEPRIWHGLKDSVITFFGLQPPHDIVDLWNWGQWLTLFVIIVGFLHLGIFVSHVYTLISRR